ncbi:Hypothetical protein PHPALM_6032 [Phytophthora palmivora]|uniref:ATP-binding cassette (ABC) Superfamily n=1 Tax=Phytophthora palmivora TaxID=4796 RepID=A0A2P4YFY0_9STRA|nr:Hypothetical protein PHPALM_6032 [Phytophthora palmivora]
MEGLRQQSKSSAQDGSVNPGTVHHPRSQQPSSRQPGAGLPAPASSVTRGIPATSQAAGASQSAAALGRFAPHGSGVPCSDQGRREEPSYAFEYEAPSQPLPSGHSTSGRDSRRKPSTSVRVHAIEIALELGPGGKGADQAGKPGALEVVRQDVDDLGRETRELLGRVDRHGPASALKELRPGLDALSHEVHGRMPSYEPQGYSYHLGYGYSSYPSSSHSVPSYPSYDSRGYQSVYHSQTLTPAAPVVQSTQPRFEEVSSHFGLPPSEEKDPADRGTA